MLCDTKSKMATKTKLNYFKIDCVASVSVGFLSANRDDFRILAAREMGRKHSFHFLLSPHFLLGQNIEKPASRSFSSVKPHGNACFAGLL